MQYTLKKHTDLQEYMVLVWNRSSPSIARDIYTLGLRGWGGDKKAERNLPYLSVDFKLRN